MVADLSGEREKLLRHSGGHVLPFVEELECEVVNGDLPDTEHGLGDALDDAHCGRHNVTALYRARKSPQPCNQWLEESYPKVRKVIPMHAKRALRKVCSLRKSKENF